jgi:hypothetical protein
MNFILFRKIEYALSIVQKVNLMELHAKEQNLLTVDLDQKFNFIKLKLLSMTMVSFVFLKMNQQEQVYKIK